MNFARPCQQPRRWMTRAAGSVTAAMLLSAICLEAQTAATPRPAPAPGTIVDAGAGTWTPVMTTADGTVTIGGAPSNSQFSAWSGAGAKHPYPASLFSDSKQTGDASAGGIRADDYFFDFSRTIPDPLMTSLAAPWGAIYLPAQNAPLQFVTNLPALAPSASLDDTRDNPDSAWAAGQPLEFSSDNGTWSAPAATPGGPGKTPETAAQPIVAARSSADTEPDRTMADSTSRSGSAVPGAEDDFGINNDSRLPRQPGIPMIASPEPATVALSVVASLVFACRFFLRPKPSQAAPTE